MMAITGASSFRRHFQTHPQIHLISMHTTRKLSYRHLNATAKETAFASTTTHRSVTFRGIAMRVSQARACRASRGGHMGAGFLMYQIAGMRGTALDTYGHYYNYASLDSASCVIDEIAGDDNGELNAANSVGISVAGSSRGCQFIAKDTGKSGTSMASDTYGTSDATEQVVPFANLSGLRALRQYQVTSGSNYLPVPSISAFATRGVAHICLSVDSHSNCNTNGFNEYVNETIIPSSSNLSIDVRGRFGTAPVDWYNVCPAATCAQLYVFPATINGGSVAGGRPTASTLFSALNDNSTVGSQSQFEVQHGAATFQNLRSEGRGMGFISTNAAGAIIASSNIPNTALTFEDTHARILTTVSPDSTIAKWSCWSFG
jgi:hypothetical protein